MFFSIFLNIQINSYKKHEVDKLTIAEKAWDRIVEEYGNLLMILSKRHESFLNEKEITRLLSEIHETYGRYILYPAFGRKDGKMFSFPPRKWEADYDPRKRPWYIAALKTPNQYVITTPFVHAVTGKPTVGISKVVFDFKGDITGVIAVDLVLERVADEILSDGMYIVDSNGEIIAKNGNIKKIFDPDTYKDKDILATIKGTTVVIAKRSIEDTFVVGEFRLSPLIIQSFLNLLLILLIIVSVILVTSNFLKKQLEIHFEEPVRNIISSMRVYLSNETFPLIRGESDVLEIKQLIDELADTISIIEAQKQELRATNEELEEAYRQLENKAIELEQAYDTLALKLSEVVEGFDEATGGHIKRVQALSKYFAEKLKLPSELVQQIERYSPLHDIGKIRISRKILNKPGKLNSEEWEIIKKHPIWGGEILSNNEKLVVAYNIALYHHERYDGTGYPFGLKGDQIPIEAQIVGFVDVYDALRSERPYKKAFSHEEATEIIFKGDEKTKPSQFNPILLKIFEEHSDEIAMIWESINP